MDLSIVIVNWNSGSYLHRLLESLSALKEEVAKIVVVDNGSTDFSESAASGNLAVELMQFQDNQGFARAANLGIGETKSRYVLLLNPDIRILPETVRGLYEEMERRPRLGIACAALFGEDGGPQEAFQIRSFPKFSSVIMDALCIDDFLSFLGSSPSPPYGSRPGEAFEVEQPAAAFWLLRTEGWREIGGFDESFYPAWFEDVDFCKRLIAAGWKIMFFPQWRVIHRGGISLRQLTYGRFVKIYYSNLLKYWKKHHKRSFPLVWLPVQLGIFLRRLLIRSEYRR